MNLKIGFILIWIIIQLVIVQAIAQSDEYCSEAKINTVSIPDAILKQEIEKFNQLQLNSGGTVPSYILKLYVKIIENSNGARACTAEDVIENIRFSNNFLRPHGICIQIANITFLNEARFWSLDKNSSILRHRIEVDGFTMFIPQEFEGEPNLWGRAFAIPNNYFAVIGPRVRERQNTVTAHEIGHCLGLLHTHETARGRENVTRAFNNPCYNCEEAGDLLCDTPADPHNRAIDILTKVNINRDIDDNCIYDGQHVDDCKQIFQVETNNLMNYAWTCQNRFSIRQGARMRHHLDNSSILQNMQVKNNILLSSFNLLSIYYSARENLIIQPLSNYNATPILNLVYRSPNLIIHPNAIFSVTNNQQDILITADLGCD